MPFDHPNTPQSPSQTFGASDLPSKVVGSPRNTHSLPTPAHSINGSMSSISDTVVDPTGRDMNTNKRKRDSEDHGDREQKKVHVEDSRISMVSIEDLHLDVGEKYLLCRTPLAFSEPRPTQDLFTLYGLHDIAKSVARFKEDGSKGIKLRKTYKNQIKEHGLSGQFDAVKRETNAPGTLLEMCNMPAEHWTATLQGREISKPIDTTPNLKLALTMARGPIPKDKFNGSVLGLPDMGPMAEVTKVAQSAARPHIPQAGGVIRTGKASKSEGPRPKRNVKKRTYGDSSFEGYGEGFVDDDAQASGYSTGEADDRGSRKRPKKNGNHFQGPPVRQHSYGPGMVGV